MAGGHWTGGRYNKFVVELAPGSWVQGQYLNTNSDTSLPRHVSDIMQTASLITITLLWTQTQNIINVRCLSVRIQHKV